MVDGKVYAVAGEQGSLLAGNLISKVVQAESKVAWVSAVAVHVGKLDGGWVHVAGGVGQAVAYS